MLGIPRKKIIITRKGCRMCGTAIVQPMDLIKTRMQVSAGQKITTADVIKSTLKNEGIAAFYNGLSAGLVRQATYTTGRMGVFNTLIDLATVDGKPPGFAVKTGIGMTAGLVGAFIGKIYFIISQKNSSFPNNCKIISIRHAG